jgi:hypothetical protein
MCGEFRWLCAAGDWTSFFSGIALMVFGGLVMIAYRPKEARNAPEKTLAFAIFLGFAAHAGNTVYWQVLGQPAVQLGWMTVPQLRFYGDWLDLLFKGGGALAAYMHLRALWLSLPENEKRQWQVLEMAFYPHRMLCLRRGLYHKDDDQ